MIIFEDFFSQAPLTKLTLTSNYLQFFPAEMDESLIQQVTIDVQGHIEFIEALSHSGLNLRRKKNQIEPLVAQLLLVTIGTAFLQRLPDVLPTDRGTWELSLENAAGMTQPFRGSLGQCFAEPTLNLSELIRTTIKLPNVIAFGEPQPIDLIQRITIDYHKVRQLNFDRFADWLHDPDFPVIKSTDDQTEQLIIDRPTATITRIHDQGSGSKITRKYEFTNQVAKLLDDFAVIGLFAYTEGQAANGNATPDEFKDYRITIDYEKKPQRVLRGSFDKNGLPEDFPTFAEELNQVFQFYDQSDLLDSEIYDKTERRPSDLIFCLVTFKGGGKSYYYLTDDEQIAAGDFVIVPAGPDNHEATAKVIEVEYFSLADAPVPVETIKRIIRKTIPPD
ncbi:hypothetical protein ACFQHW_01750 [Lapidilactobacillus achengensis]|uniref:Uncharacterized protein n=1 Tax=Lapidilactobacillus achengensis TaxID=2486000 RepID=A0ABW1UMJ9_9LACO|nr:hypothetical protein [Lapidilactobacillus achengensis]